MKTTLSISPKRSKLTKRIGFGFLVVGGIFIFFFGYCWGLWGRSSLILQYFFQCKCPINSEQTRYPSSVEVIISACSQSWVRLSPSGRYLYVREQIPDATNVYLLDLQTMEKIITEDQQFSSFLTDDIWLIKIGFEDYIFERTTNTKYLVQRFVYLYPDAEINNETNMVLLIEKLKQSQDVFLISHGIDTIVALSSNFSESIENNFIVSQFDLPNNNLEDFLKENNIIYQSVLPDYPDEVISSNSLFTAQSDGIYLIDTGEKIVAGYSSSIFYRAYSRKYFRARGWVYDNSGVIYSKFLNPCLIETGFFILDDPMCIYEVTQPVLKLKVPQEYLDIPPE